MDNNLINYTIDESIEELNNIDKSNNEEKNVEINCSADDNNALDTNKETLEQNEPETVDINDANTSNCLALTIIEDHKLVAVKNVFLHSLKVTWKVIVSTITLHILKMFF